MNVELRIAIIKRCGSQIIASMRSGIRESELSRIVRGHRAPTKQERVKLRKLLGHDYFAQEMDGPRAA